MVYYIIFVIYEDGSEYQSVIKNQKDIDNIPSSNKNKAYETIRIFYYDNTEYSHVIYGRDNVFLRYDDDDKCLYYSQFDDDQEFTQVIKLKGIGKEEIFTESTKNLPEITFKGAGLPDDEYEKLVQRCHQWRVSESGLK